MFKNELIGTLLGDAYMMTRNDYIRFCIEHSPAQLDYLEHKAELLKELGSTCLYKRNTRNIYRSETSLYGFPYMYDICYPNKKKNIVNIMKLSTNPTLSVAYWLMDDGCISASTKNSGKKSPRLGLATCSETSETLNEVIKWFKSELDLDSYIMIQRNTKRNTQWNILKFPVRDSMLLWEKVRDHILVFPSMRHKFRHMETEYQRMLKEYIISKSGGQTELTLPENICRTYVKRKRKK